MTRAGRGRWGEERAADYLRDKGYVILGTGVRSRYGEIDIIAQKDGVVAFVEVKLRKNAAFAAAREFVDARKQNKLRDTALLWLAGQNQDEWQPRFDVIEVYATLGEPPRLLNLEHLENAFE